MGCEGQNQFDNDGPPAISCAYSFSASENLSDFAIKAPDVVVYPEVIRKLVNKVLELAA